MNNYVTTNIRLPEEDYLRLKEEAAKSRKSLSAIIREKIGVKSIVKKSPNEIIKTIRTHARESEQNLKDIDIVEILREMRYQGKW
jgi:hypothetical protein